MLSACTGQVCYVGAQFIRGASFIFTELKEDATGMTSLFNIVSRSLGNDSKAKSFLKDSVGMVDGLQIVADIHYFKTTKIEKDGWIKYVGHVAFAVSNVAVTCLWVAGMRGVVNEVSLKTGWLHIFNLTAKGGAVAGYAADALDAGKRLYLDGSKLNYERWMYEWLSLSSGLLGATVYSISLAGIAVNSTSFLMLEIFAYAVASSKVVYKSYNSEKIKGPEEAKELSHAFNAGVSGGEGLEKISKFVLPIFDGISSFVPQFFDAIDITHADFKRPFVSYLNCHGPLQTFMGLKGFLHKDAQNSFKTDEGGINWKFGNKAFKFIQGQFETALFIEAIGLYGLGRLGTEKIGNFVVFSALKDLASGASAFCGYKDSEKAIANSNEKPITNNSEKGKWKQAWEIFKTKDVYSEADKNAIKQVCEVDDVLFGNHVSLREKVHSEALKFLGVSELEQGTVLGKPVEERNRHITEAFSSEKSITNNSEKWKQAWEIFKTKDVYSEAEKNAIKQVCEVDDVLFGNPDSLKEKVHSEALKFLGVSELEQGTVLGKPVEERNRHITEAFNFREEKVSRENAKMSLKQARITRLYELSKLSVIALKYVGIYFGWKGVSSIYDVALVTLSIYSGAAGLIKFGHGALFKPAAVA